MSKPSFDIKVTAGPRGNGYADLHLMYNRLCLDSQGSFLFLWNDDVTMMTVGWDDMLAQHDDGRACYVTSKVADTRGRDSFLFPIVHRSYYEALGHFSRSPHNDTYIYSVFKPYPEAFRHADITVYHHALQIDDATGQDARKWWPKTKSDWDSRDVQEALAQDTIKLGELLKRQKGVGR